ncbi:MAG TPA: DUF4166 domain-containing protein [Rhizomicrobium sp.]|nr:DUF4166 domain-containing protein [Rhizomicrobium sp.]
MEALRVLIIGGYGTFGGRLARLLADEPCLMILIAGRSFAKARAACDRLTGNAQFAPTLFDRNGDIAAQFKALMPDIVIDTSGPFQDYGAHAYRVVEACVTLRIPYLDLADDPKFVEGIAQFDAAAKNAGVFVLSGVSTVPTLSTAVIRRLSRDMTVISDVSGGIAPSPFAGVGLSVVTAITSYAGKTLRIRHSGRDVNAPALIDSRCYTIAPPGRLPLRRLRFSLVDVPDLSLVPKLWPQVKSHWMGAAPQPVFLHRVLSTLSWLVRLRLVPTLKPLASLCHRVLSVLRWGEKRGGMFMEVTGATRSGEPLARSWQVIAEGNEGPFIPSVPASVIIRNVLAGKVPKAGASACTNEVELEDYEAIFAQHGIVTGVRECKASDATLPLYRRYLGSAWSELPEPIRTMHDATGTWVAEGRADIERGKNPLARVAAFINRFPKAGRDVPITVKFEARDGRETWTRNFAGKQFSSVQYEGRSRDEGLICERFGPLVFAMALVICDGRMRLAVRQWSAFGIPLPRLLMPVGNTFESGEEGKFQFHVEIGFRWTGLIVRYSGWLVRR